MEQENIDSLVSIDGVLYPIHKNKGGKFTMRYAGIDLHPADTTEILLEAFSGHRVNRYKSSDEFREWYEEMLRHLIENNNTQTGGD